MEDKSPEEEEEGNGRSEDEEEVVVVVVVVVLVPTVAEAEAEARESVEGGTGTDWGTMSPADGQVASAVAVVVDGNGGRDPP